MVLRLVCFAVLKSPGVGVAWILRILVTSADAVAVNYWADGDKLPHWRDLPRVLPVVVGLEVPLAEFIEVVAVLRQVPVGAFVQNSSRLERNRFLVFKVITRL